MSVWKCLLKITLSSLVVLPLFILQRVISSSGPDMDWGSVSYWMDVLEVVLWMYLPLLPFIWGFGVYFCVVVPRRRFSRPLGDFVSRYIPDATIISEEAPTNFIVKAKGHEFEVVYTNRYKVMTGDGGEQRKKKGTHVVATYFEYREQTVDEYFDDEGYLRDEICEEFETLCKSDYPILDYNFYTLWTVVDEKQLESDSQAIENAMEKMVMVMKRLDLKPLTFKELQDLRKSERESTVIQIQC